MKQTKPILRMEVRVMLVVTLVLLFCSSVLFIVLLMYSPGKIKPFFDENKKKLQGSISEKITIDINGVDQGMIIQGKDRTNPVLLFVHGGPGMPQYFMNENYPTGIEDYFTVCWWEQRGAGLSYQSNLIPENVSVEQYIADTVEVTNYLRKRFGQDKIYLMAHSWGTFIGIQTVAQKPDLYKAYIGMSQVSTQAESEKIAFQYMLDQYTLNGNSSMVKKLQNVPTIDSQIDLLSYYNLSVRDEGMHKLGIGTMRNMKSVVTGIFLPVMKCRAYTLGEKINIWRGKAFLSSSTNLRKRLLETDLTKAVLSIDVPIYFLCGKFDYTVLYSLSNDYFNLIQAPIKGFYTFEQSAHSPMFEEPEKFIQIMKKNVLSEQTTLADKVLYHQ